MTILLILPFSIGLESHTTQLVDTSKAIENIKLIKLIRAISVQESSLNPKAINKKENAVGLLQIRPIMLKEVNRISKIKYKDSDRFDPKKSIEMFFIIKNYYHKNNNLEHIARCWNYGTNGHEKESTIKYWKSIKKYL